MLWVSTTSLFKVPSAVVFSPSFDKFGLGPWIREFLNSASMANVDKLETVDKLDNTASSPTEIEELKKSITVDTVHQDEALKVLANYEGPTTWSRDEEKKLVRKIDIRLLSLLCLTYGLQYYDKAMLSQAVRLSPVPSLPLKSRTDILHNRPSSASVLTSASTQEIDTPCPPRSFT